MCIRDSFCAVRMVMAAAARIPMRMSMVVAAAARIPMRVSMVMTAAARLRIVSVVMCRMFALLLSMLFLLVPFHPRTSRFSFHHLMI